MKTEYLGHRAARESASPLGRGFGTQVDGLRPNQLQGRPLTLTRQRVEIERIVYLFEFDFILRRSFAL